MYQIIKTLLGSIAVYAIMSACSSAGPTTPAAAQEITETVYKATCDHLIPGGQITGTPPIQTPDTYYAFMPIQEESYTKLSRARAYSTLTESQTSIPGYLDFVVSTIYMQANVGVAVQCQQGLTVTFIYPN